MLADPPRAIGHPTAWPARPRIKPNAALGGVPSGSVACADIPAKSPRARWPRNTRRANQVVAGRAARPKRARRRGWRGTFRGPSVSCSVSCHRSTNGAMRCCHALASAPNWASILSTERSRSTAVPSSIGCAMGTGGWTHSRPCCCNGRRRKNGDAMPSGWTAEQTSCRKPGCVSGSVRAPPPGASFASRTSTRRPARARTMAADKPFGPAPTTIASNSRTGLVSLGRWLAGPTLPRSLATARRARTDTPGSSCRTTLPSSGEAFHVYGAAPPVARCLCALPHPMAKMRPRRSVRPTTDHQRVAAPVASAGATCKSIPRKPRTRNGMLPPRANVLRSGLRRRYIVTHDRRSVPMSARLRGTLSRSASTCVTTTCGIPATRPAPIPRMIAGFPRCNLCGLIEHFHAPCATHEKSAALARAADRIELARTRSIL